MHAQDFPSPAANSSTVQTTLARIGHRGAPRIAPANTMAAFRAAAEYGCDWIECDCRASKDGIIVLAHDNDVEEPRAGAEHRVDRLSAEALRRLDLGSGDGVPTLDELVAWAAQTGIGVMADVKVGGFEHRIGDALAPLAADRKIVAGADDRGRARFRALFPGVPLSLTVSRLQVVGLNARIRGADVEALTLEYPLVTSARVAAAHERGLRVYPWTADDLPTMRALVAMGVDGIISNRPDLLAEL